MDGDASSNDMADQQQQQQQHSDSSSSDGGGRGSGSRRSSKSSTSSIDGTGGHMPVAMPPSLYMLQNMAKGKQPAPAPGAPLQAVDSEGLPTHGQVCDLARQGLPAHGQMSQGKAWQQGNGHACVLCLHACMLRAACVRCHPAQAL